MILSTDFTFWRDLCNKKKRTLRKDGEHNWKEAHNGLSFLFNHIDIPVIRYRKPICWRAVGISSIIIPPSPPVIFHFHIQFFLRLPGTTICKWSSLSSIVFISVASPASNDSAPCATSPSSSVPQAHGRWYIAVHTFGRWLTCIRSPRCPGTTTSTPPRSAPATSIVGWRILDALEKAPTRLDCRVEGIANSRCSGAASITILVRYWSCWGGRYEGEAYGLPVRICAVIFADGLLGVTDGCVCHESSARGATSAIETKGERGYWTYLSEEALWVSLATERISRLAQGSHFKIVLCKVVVKVVDTKFCTGGFPAQRDLEER